jgi:16S rRNA (guanine966-N2)-methyltransferase
MRVIAGELGGRRLQAPPGTDTRPTSDRVREALFSALGPVDGAEVLDLFAGSGALAIEALSRGAAHATLVERDARAVAVIRRNLDALGLGADRATVRRRDALRALQDANASGSAYDLVLIDPPYRLAAGLGPELSQALTPVLRRGARVVCESDRRAPLELDGLVCDFERRYGDTLVRIFSLHAQ